MKSLSPLFAFVRIAFAPDVLSLVAMLVCACSNAASFVEDDQIIVRRAAPMFFRSEKYRDGNEGETFQVLAFRPELKKVFVLAKGKDGKDIALAIDSDAVELVPADPTAALAKAQAAVNAKYFTQAVAVIERALRSNPGEASLNTALQTIKDAAVAWRAIDESKANAARMVAEVNRLRRNAAVTDRPNPLNPQDTSNRDRAAQMRKQADDLESKSLTASSDAEAKFAAAVSELKGLAVSRPQPAISGSAPGSNPLLINPKATSAEAGPAQTTIMAHPPTEEELRADREERAKHVAKFLAEWEEDAKHPGVPAGTPAELSKFKNPDDGAPGYDTTIEFINGRMGASGKLWFSEKRNKMILMRESNIAVFDSAEMNPEVTYAVKGRTFSVEATGKKGVIQVFEYGREPHQAFRLNLVAADNIEQQKLVKAWARLIELCGGRPDPF